MIEHVDHCVSGNGNLILLYIVQKLIKTDFVIEILVHDFEKFVYNFKWDFERDISLLHILRWTLITSSQILHT